MARFEDKVAIVTGGANGIGEGIVRRLVNEGANVVIADIEEERMQAVCVGLNSRALGIVTDVTEKEQVDQMVRMTLDKYGKIDILFNNAGIISYAPFLEIEIQDWYKVMDVNLNACFVVGQAVAKEMVRLDIKGSIINTSSVAGSVVSSTTGAYSPSKAGMMLLTKLMALELAPYGIRVNSFAPGPALTRFTEKTRSNPQRVEAFMGNIPTKRFGEVKELVSVALFLASEEASYVTGDTYFVDGGFRIQ